MTTELIDVLTINDTEGIMVAQRNHGRFKWPNVKEVARREVLLVFAARCYLPPRGCPMLST